MSNAQPGGTWIKEPAAIDASRRGIADYGLERDPVVAHALQNGQPGRPLLVEQLEKPQSSYYLIPWALVEGVVCVVRVNAFTGAMLGVTTFSKPTPSPFVTSEEAVKRARSRFPERTFGEPRLVWRPCRESTTPTRPFYQIPFDGKVLYVDMEGAVLEKLTSLGLGGGQTSETCAI